MIPNVLDTKRHCVLGVPATLTIAVAKCNHDPFTAKHRVKCPLCATIVLLEVFQTGNMMREKKYVVCYGSAAVRYPEVNKSLVVSRR